MNQVTIYHNPRCSKSRASLELLQHKNVNLEIVLYQQSPPTSQQLESILNKLNMNPRDIMRKNESDYKSNNMENPALTRAELIDYMVQFPAIMQRPIVLANNQAAIGRPPENVLAIL
ncbi:MAG: arsenate reductase (glutaredoxin) [Proteobacteria bacterium]|nr:arsenate reductase (glutaredoxin) [Pseudomonadota bacterium]